MEIHKVAVVGAGTLGAGLASVVCLSGLPVLLKDDDLSTAVQGVARVKKTLLSRVNKGLLSAGAAESCLRRITPVDHYGWFDQVDLVLEAARDTLEVKHRIFEELDDATRPEVILATNTSFLSITRIGAITRRPAQVIGMHFFHPAHVMKLVEVVAGLGTDEDVIDAAVGFCERLGKTAVRVEECPSFLVNRLLDRFLNEALFLLAGGTSVGQIDQVACDIAMPMGPLALLDLMGVDTWRDVAQHNFEEYGLRFEPCRLLDQLFQKGWFGQKSGKGFYLYPPDSRTPTAVNPELADLMNVSQGGSEKGFGAERLFLPMIHEAFMALSEGIVAPTDLDPALRAGLGMRKGPLQLAEEFGLSDCLDQSMRLFSQYGERYRPAGLLKRLVWGRRTLVVR